VSSAFRVAVVGASGVVGETLIRVLEERAFPVTELFALASPRSLGKKVRFRDADLAVDELAAFDFRRAEIAFFCAGAAVSREQVPRATAAGCTVIDHSSAFRLEEDVPLVVPEVNAPLIAQGANRGIIANPNSSTIQLLVALKPLYDAAGIERINVATYQAVSGAGRRAVEELAVQSAALLGGQGAVAASVFAKQIAFNCVPQIGAFEDNGYTREEMRMLWESRKILADPAIRVNATAVRVPVFFGDSQAVHLETRAKITAEQARALLIKAPGISVMDERTPGGYPTAATEAANRDTVYVGRIREDISTDRGLNLWLVADNVRKGSATNGIQIAEILVREQI
jgi:aspartate-semialdehyde dehydrogenase